jgi:hypothetical protein
MTQPREIYTGPERVVAGQAFVLLDIDLAGVEHDTADEYQLAVHADQRALSLEIDAEGRVRVETADGAQFWVEKKWLVAA